MFLNINFVFTGNCICIPRLIMSEDREIMHAVWDGKLPVCVHMAPDESAASVAHTEPFYVMVPRMSYFPIVLDKVKSEVYL